MFIWDFTPEGQNTSTTLSSSIPHYEMILLTVAQTFTDTLEVQIDILLYIRVWCPLAQFF